jgi:hypothetical protein
MDPATGKDEPMTRSSRRDLRWLPLAALLALAPLAACNKSEPPTPAPAPAAGSAAAPAPGASGSSTGGTAPAAGAPAGGAASAAAAGPLKVVSLGLGKSVGPDKKVPEEVDTFAKGDTFYASVGTTGGSPGAKLAVRWASFGHGGAEKVMNEETQAIAPAGDAWTEFHVARPEGWPAGDYNVEIRLDGKLVAVKAFRVSK